MKLLFLFIYFFYLNFYFCKPPPIWTRTRHSKPNSTAALITPTFVPPSSWGEGGHHGIPCHWSLSIHSENRKSVWLKWVDRYLLYQAFWNSLGYSTEGYSKLFPSETLFWINILAQSQQWKHQNNNWNLLQVNNRHLNDTIGVVEVSLLLTLNRFHTMS